VACAEVFTGRPCSSQEIAWKSIPEIQHRAFELDNRRHSLVTIVIDGLDECDKRDDVGKLVELLRSITNIFSLRLFITSCPEDYIVQAFELHAMGNTGFCKTLMLWKYRGGIRTW
jgi:hypothetical protein